MKTVKFILPVVLIMATAFILLFQPELLSSTFYGTKTMPLGTLISWIGLVAYAWILYLIRPIRKRPLSPVWRDALYLNFFAAVFWGFVSYLLAGNWQFNFSNQFGFYIWLIYIAAIILLPVITYVSWLFKAKKK